jgi:hypothetical protein
MVIEYWFAINSPNNNGVISVSKIKKPTAE